MSEAKNGPDRRLVKQQPHLLALVKFPVFMLLVVPSFSEFFINRMS